MVSNLNIFKLPQNDWSHFFENQSELINEIAHKYAQAIDRGDTIYPKREDIFRAFEITPCEAIRVVILGQDPYHTPGMAHGLSFSVPEGCKIPPSLKNILRECGYDLKQNMRSSDLTDWAMQGVMLLNCLLTVSHGQAGSHYNWGWEQLTDNVIAYINSSCKDVVFLLMGNYAISKKHLIDQSIHTIIETAHPSPLSAYRGFLGSNVFGVINDLLSKKGYSQIKW